MFNDKQRANTLTTYYKIVHFGQVHINQ